MVASVTAPAKGVPFTSNTIPLAGLAATTAYVVTILDPDGWTTRFEVTTDGSGAASINFVPQAAKPRGSYAISVRPRTEWAGTTTAAATASFPHGG